MYPPGTVSLRGFPLFLEIFLQAASDGHHKGQDIWVGESLVSPNMVTVVCVAALVYCQRHAWGIKRKHKAFVTEHAL